MSVEKILGDEALSVRLDEIAQFLLSFNLVIYFPVSKQLAADFSIWLRVVMRVASPLSALEIGLQESGIRM